MRLRGCETVRNGKEAVKIWPNQNQRVSVVSVHALGHMKAQDDVLPLLLCLHLNSFILAPSPFSTNVSLLSANGHFLEHASDRLMVFSTMISRAVPGH